MEKIMIKSDLEHSKLEELGYEYSIMEGGYISKDASTIVIMTRRPYIREVQKCRPNMDAEYMKNVEQLRDLGLLEE